MNENENKNKDENCSCLNSISFTIIGIFIIIFELFSLIMSILCIAITNWNFVQNFIKILNIFSLVIISLIIIINSCIFIKIKHENNNIIINFRTRMTISFFLLIFYVLLIIFNVYNAIYLSIKLHIADYPEYGGRKRDQNYIDKHPDEFGNVPLKQFVIVAFCPSIISVLNLVCLILSILFRKKMITAYNKIKSENANIITVAVKKHNSPRRSHSNKNSPRRKSHHNTINIENIQKMDTGPNSDKNDLDNDNDFGNKNAINIKFDALEKEKNGNRHIKRVSNKSLFNKFNNRIESKENFNDNNNIKIEENEDKKEIDGLDMNIPVKKYNSAMNSPKKKSIRKRTLSKKNLSILDKKDQ